MEVPFAASGPFAVPDALSAAASYVDREYGVYGYCLAPAIRHGAVTVFEVNHADGSRFNIAADRWGNVQTLPDTVPAAVDALNAMHRRATAA